MKRWLDNCPVAELPTWRILFKSRFWFSSSGVGLETLISSKLPSHFWNTLGSKPLEGSDSQSRWPSAIAWWGLGNRYIWAALPEISIELMWGLPIQGFPCGSDGKESACDAGNPDLILGLGRFPRRREWLLTPVFLSGEAWWAIVHGVAKCQTWLSN